MSERNRKGEIKYTVLTYILSEILLRIFSIGKKPICNLAPSRAPHIGKVCFPLCWRCTSILIAYYIGISRVSEAMVFSKSKIIIGLLLQVPVTVDGGRQYYFNKESTNIRRIVTGLISGIGLAIIMKDMGLR